MSDFRKEFESVTYTHIWYALLQDLAKQHLDMDIDPLIDLEANNDTWKVIKTTLADIEDWESDTYRAIAELRDKGIIPDQPVLLWIMW